MSFPGEELVSTAIDSLANGIIKKLDESEARREREFTLKLKELEFYKSNYDKELRDIFDFWFDLVRIIQIKDNEHLTEQERSRYEKEYAKMLNVEKIAKYKMNTIKYGGSETGRIFAVENVLHQKLYEDKPSTVALYIWCAILSVLKKEILGQTIDPSDIIRILVNNYDDNEKDIILAKEYIAKVYKSIYKEQPYWLQ